MNWLKNLTKKLIGTEKITFNNGDNIIDSEEDYIEVTPTKKKNISKINIKYYTIDDYSNIKLILNKVREGDNIILINIKKLRAKDISELKRAVAKIKKTCEAVGGDITGIEENLILIYPSFVSLSKEDFE